MKRVFWKQIERQWSYESSIIIFAFVRTFFFYVPTIQIVRKYVHFLMITFTLINTHQDRVQTCVTAFLYVHA